MSADKSNKIMATATVAIALSSAVQAIVAMHTFDSETWYDVMGLIAIGIMVVILVILAFRSWNDLY